jgi:polyisoprenoid-binding protein YceI
MTMQTTPRLSLLALAVLLMAGFAGHAPAKYAIDKAHSAVSFRVRHLGISNVTGYFRQYDASIELDGNDLRTFKATASIDVASIDTENGMRDNHLKSPDFFEVEKYPKLTFTSKRIQNINGNNFQIVGDLTIKATTKEVVLNAEYLGTTRMRDTEKVGFSASTTINRKEFGLMWDRITEAGGIVVSDEVRINLEIEADKQPS